MKKIYIAGPDVFEKDSIEIGKKLVKICSLYGFEGLYPLDNVVDLRQEKHKIAKDIFEANAAMIQSADIVIANLSSFRGKEADSGTVWECGYAHGLGKKVYGYMDRDGCYIDQFELKKEENGMYWDEENRFIEDFDHAINLMIACSCLEIIHGTFEDAVKKCVYLP
jgi:nucleoside 2-deoxyribosyltransferase